jgi:hypothetical protein
MSAQLWNSTQRSIDSFLSNKAANALGGIKNPFIKDIAGGLLNSFIPGFGGGIPDFRESAFSTLVDKRQRAVDNQLKSVISVYRDSEAAGALQNTYDWRARLRPKSGGKEKFYSAGTDADYLLRPIKESNGLVWQYTPSVTMGGTVEYNQTLLHGMNYPINTFINSRPNEINITGEFTANDIYEARYMLAMLIFMRISTKAYFGDAAVAEGTFGTPPPVMLFEYLGEHGFNKVPVVITSYGTTLPDDIDYVPVVCGPGEMTTVTYLPTKLNLSVTLTPSYTPHKVRSRFNLTDVTNGKAYKRGFI